MQQGSNLSPDTLVGLSPGEIETSLQVGDAMGQAIYGAAAIVTAALCVVTHNHPASVCDTPGVKAAARKIAASA